MVQIKSDWSAVGKLAGAVGAARSGFPRERRRAFLQATGLMQRNIKETILRPRSPFGPLVGGKAGGLLASWQASAAADGMSGQTASSKIYSSVMELGRRPGSRQPPRQAIENWIRDKRIVEKGEKAVKALGRVITGGKRFLKIKAAKRKVSQSQQAVLNRKIGALKRKLARHTLDRKVKAKHIPKPRKKLTPAERKERFTKALAFMIARSIGKKGIQGRFYVHDSLTRSMPHLDAIFQAVGGYIVHTVVAA